MPDDKVIQKRYVAYFDMLGLKTATLRNPIEAWKALKSLQGCMDKILNLDVEVTSKKVFLRDRIQAFILADSVLIFTGEDELYDLSAILTLTSELFAQALSKCVPLRGAITHGEFFYIIDKRLFGGIPFVKAYELERKAQWSGVVIDDDVVEHYKRWFNDMPKCQDGSSIIASWDIPLKGDKREQGLCLDWVKPHKADFRIQPPISVSDYYSGFKDLFGNFDDLPLDVQSKYINTVEFVNHSLI
ncbi:hypothetical protein ACFLQ8_03985 [Candidatus Auribacterota bacterium]